LLPHLSDGARPHATHHHLIYLEYSMRGSPLRHAALLVSVVVALLTANVDLQAQQVVVRGTVSDAASSEPIAAAAVSVKGTSIGTQTNDRGSFTLQLRGPNDTLVVSRLGFARLVVPVNGRTTVDVALTRTAVSLSEVVVVGYGTQKRSDVTGSVSSISQERLQDVPNTSVLQALQGAVPGVTVRTTGGGAEPDNSVMIRGRHSITANTAPLVVLDGIPFNGSLSEINQNDVASIDILKDASAAAIYGSRGSNGVILITSKQGDGKPRVSYEGYAGIQQIAHLPRLMTGAEFIAVKCQRVSAGQNCDADFTTTELANIAAGNSTDWVDLATRTGMQQQHNLSVAGGTGGTHYRLSGSDLTVKGIARNDAFDRYTLGFNLDQELGKRLKVGTTTQLSYTNRGGMPADFEDASRMNPLTNAFQADGSQTVYPWPEDTFFANPLQGLLVTNKDLTRRVFTSNHAELALPFLEGLSYRVNAGLDYASGDVARYYGRNTRTGFAAGGAAITSNSTRSDWTLENLLRYTHSFGQHSVDLTTLYSIAGHTAESQGLTAKGFPNDVLTYYQPNLAREFDPSAGITESNLESQMARLNYNYASRYLVTLTARRDGYSGFGSNNKFGVFPSAAIGWNISDESFWPFADRFNSLKLRLSYGKNGNQAIPPYKTLARLNDQSYVDEGTSLPGFIPSTLGNRNLRWETTTTTNVGADFGLLDDRITGSVDVYSSKTNDLLLNRAISPTHGIDVITENIGATANHGVELSLSTLNIKRSNLTWRTDFNIAADRSKIVDLYGNGEDDLVNQWFLGQPIDVNFGYQFAGIWQAGDDIANSAQPTAKAGDIRVRDVNGDGKIDPLDRTFLGQVNPSYTAGLGSTLRYREFTLNAFLHSVQGVTKANALFTDNLGDDGRYNTILKQYWTPENPINSYPANRPATNLGLPVGFYQDASFIRLKDVTLSYDVPERLASHVGVGSLRVYVNGHNLWTHTKWIGLDPELSSQFSTPLERSFIGGIDVHF
jgi:TonB-linked SusC/RagA family outer membrane protein